MITNEEARKAIEKYQKEHPLHFGTMIDVTAISSKEGADIISQTIEQVRKKVDEDTELWCICEMAKMYMQGVRPVYPVKPQGEWIPVSERLPEEHLCDDGYIEPSDYVLVWGDHGNYGVSRYWGNRRSKSESPNTHKDWVDLDWVVQKPIAWMPLPEPYKEGGKLV